MHTIQGIKYILKDPSIMTAIQKEILLMYYPLPQIIVVTRIEPTENGEICTCFCKLCADCECTCEQKIPKNVIEELYVQDNCQ